MKSDPRKDRLRDEGKLAMHLAGLVALDPTLSSVIEHCQPVPLRAATPGFEGLARIIVGQLLSVQSAAAIWQRFQARLGNVNCRRFAELGESGLDGVGLSKAKLGTLVAISTAEMSGELDYDKIAEMSLHEAQDTLLEIKGIGPWTAEVYLSFCVGHPDIFPAGDLALRKIFAHHMGLDGTPSENEVRKLTQKWSPHRGAAARLMWRYYALVRSQEGILL